jgi:hypothetical protein
MDFETNALKHIEELTNEIRLLNKRISDIREAARDICKHKHTRHYQWEHDNGYGNQEWMTGLECLLCGKRNSWPGMSQLWG